MNKKALFCDGTCLLYTSDMEAYVGTDEYVEEIAKEKLGLVNENEIILKAK